MNYPLISEYIEAIKSSEYNFATLTNLRPVLGEDKNPVMTSGNFAVVFKMKDEQSGKFYAVKCFLKDQPRRTESYKMIADELEFTSSTYLVHFKYLEKELFVDTKNSDEDEFPMLVMDWVDGITLDQYIRKSIDDQYALQMLAYQFSKLAMWIIPQPFAHGDIKPDNIMVRENGSLVLIDYDGMYVPAMKGQKASELGSPEFRHPSRTEDKFDEHIDDFSLISILLSLRAIANEPSLLEKYGASDRLLFSENDYRKPYSCDILRDFYPSSDMEINKLVGIYNIALVQGNLSDVSIQLLNLIKPNEKDWWTEEKQDDFIREMEERNKEWHLENDEERSWTLREFIQHGNYTKMRIGANYYPFSGGGESVIDLKNDEGKTVTVFNLHNYTKDQIKKQCDKFIISLMRSGYYILWKND